jgi:hypothetical protein
LSARAFRKAEAAIFLACSRRQVLRREGQSGVCLPRDQRKLLKTLVSDEEIEPFPLIFFGRAWQDFGEIFPVLFDLENSPDRVHDREELTCSLLFL